MRERDSREPLPQVNLGEGIKRPYPTTVNLGVGVESVSHEGI
jgi:hypothetical protein